MVNLLQHDNIVQHTAIRLGQKVPQCFALGIVPQAIDIQ
jgi:hypothetical protein